METEKKNQTKIRENLDRILRSGSREFLPIKTIRSKLPASVRKSLGIASGEISQKAIMRVIKPCLGDRFSEYKKGGTLYIGFSKTIDEMIKDHLQKHPGISSKRLKNKLPCTQAEFLTALIRLLANGTVRCTALYRDHVIASLQLEETGSQTEFPQAGLPQTPKEELDRFREAYLEAGGGKPYVYIHKIRKRLKWPRTLFDRVLSNLSQSDTIMLQGGDPSRLSAGELEDSFTDALGYRRITVSWRKTL